MVSCQPAKFHCPRLAGNFARGVGNTPSPDLHALKWPSSYRVNTCSYDPDGK